MTQAFDSPRVRHLQSVGARVPPHDLDAEESLLGAMLLSRDAIAAALECCGAEDFYKPAHAQIFEAICSLYSRGEPADPVTVADEMRRSGALEAIGEPSVLLSLQVNTPSTANASHYARIVEEHSLLRRLVGVAGEIAELGYSVPEDVAAAVDRAEAMVFDVAQRRMVDTMSALRDLLAQSLDHLEALVERGETVTGIPSGFTDLDERLAGFQKSNLVVVGARPSAGKTSLALGIVNHAAVHARVPVLMFSLEMSHLELTQRMLCSEARVDAMRMRNGRLLESDWPKISSAIGRLGDAPIYFDDNPNVTVMDIRAKARRLKAREGLGLVVIDYLQLMTGHARSRAENRQVEVSEISRGLKVLARELDIPVVALSQLSRNLEMRQDKRPVLADLRESGCLTGDTRVTRADTGAEITMSELVRTGAQNIPVWALDEHLKLVEATMSHAFASGIKPVFEMRLSSGRKLKASANHKFRTPRGWRPLEELAVGDKLAVPGALPRSRTPRRWPDAEVVMLAHLIGDGCFVEHQPVHYTSADAVNLRTVEEAAAHFGVTPRRVSRGRLSKVFFPAPYRLARGKLDPVSEWLEALGLRGRRSYEKFVPQSVFELSDDQVTLFLRHLWATDGHVGMGGPNDEARCQYGSSSRRLAEDVQALLLRFGIKARIDSSTSGSYRPMHEVGVPGTTDQLRFLASIGVAGSAAVAAPAVRERLRRMSDPPRSESSGRHHGVHLRFRHSSGLATLTRVRPAGDDVHAEPGGSEVVWEEIVAIEERGEEPVYDATVLEHHNFLANGIVAHNSIEQDADVVLFIYRDEIYNPDSPDRGKAEIIIAKHRNGPTGIVELAFVDHHTRFTNMARV